MQDVNLVSTTPTNRVVVNTENYEQSQYLYGFAPNNPQSIIIDWIQCTIFDNFGHSEREYFNILFGVNPDDVLFENSGLFSYSYTYSYKNIKILSSEDSSLGYHLYVTGAGCRNIEELNISYKSLFKTLIRYNSKFTRIDISIDDFTKDYFNLTKLAYYINNGLVRSKFKSTIHFNKVGVNNNKLNGDTIWFGSRSSQVQVCFYDKLQERINNNYLVNSDIKSWVRTEVRFRDLKAQDVVLKYAIQDFELNSLLKGVLINYIQFLKRSDSDSNKSRWTVANWWLDFTDNVDRLRLSTLPLESSITKKQNWLDFSVSKSEFAVFISNIPNLSSDYVTSEFIYNLLYLGSSKITDKDIAYINEYRTSRGYSPIDKDFIDSFLNDVKEIIISKKSR